MDTIGQDVHSTLDSMLSQLETDGFNYKTDARALAMLCVFDQLYDLSDFAARYSALQTDEYIDQIQQHDSGYGVVLYHVLEILNSYAIHR